MLLVFLLALIVIAAIAAAAFVLLHGPWASRPFVAAFVAFALLVILYYLLQRWSAAGLLGGP